MISWTPPSNSTLSGGVTGYKDVSGASGLLSALTQQPVSVAIEADQVTFQNYKTGTITSGCGINLHHGVLAAGYDSTAAYYLVKNSEGRGPDALRLAREHVLQSHRGHDGFQWTSFTIRSITKAEFDSLTVASSLLFVEI